MCLEDRNTISGVKGDSFHARITHNSSHLGDRRRAKYSGGVVLYFRQDVASFSIAS